MAEVDISDLSATEIAASVKSGSLAAGKVVEAILARIAALDPKLNAFTAILSDRARKRARALDKRRADGDDPGPLAGVPFAVKNLFDLDGVPTVAGSKINLARKPAIADAVLVQRLEAAGAICVGALNMGEYAYDFTGENVHYGPSRNPHALDHMSGGSSGGSASAVGGGLVPLALGSDTNGSIRVPASLCGIFGLKPTYGRLPRTGSFPFVASFDHLGPFARRVEDLALAYDAMQGIHEGDGACADRPPEPVHALLERGIEGLRFAELGGYFAEAALPDARDAVGRVAAALGITQKVEIEGSREARSAAFLITTIEGASLHLGRLRERVEDFDAEVRTRLLAGAIVPGSLAVKAQKFRRLYRQRALELFKRFDILIAPATPSRAPLIGQKTFMLDGVEIPVRANLGLYTQPISFIGLPVVAVPLFSDGEALPIGVQIIGPPWREDLVLRVAHYLQSSGVATVRRPFL